MVLLHPKRQTEWEAAPPSLLLGAMPPSLCLPSFWMSLVHPSPQKTCDFGPILTDFRQKSCALTPELNDHLFDLLKNQTSYYFLNYGRYLEDDGNNWMVIIIP